VAASAYNLHERDASLAPVAGGNAQSHLALTLASARCVIATAASRQMPPSIESCVSKNGARQLAVSASATTRERTANLAKAASLSAAPPLAVG